MLEWGWRIPFLCAAVTAVIGSALRRNMPEPKAFLKAARMYRLQSGKVTDDAVKGIDDEDTGDVEEDTAKVGDRLTARVAPPALPRSERQPGCCLRWRRWLAGA